MNLYALKDLYLGKDLYDEITVEYIVNTNDQGVFNYINTQHDGFWAGEPYENDEEEMAEVEATKLRIMENKGDLEENYAGEFYDVKHKWELRQENIPIQAVQTLELLRIIPPTVRTDERHGCAGVDSYNMLCGYSPSTYGEKATRGKATCLY